jgi:aspartate-semialdehyde dehydrogenase
MKALVIGATGAVGKDLVQQLSEDSSFERVEIIESQEILKVQ